MPAPRQFGVTAISSAPPEALYRLLSDAPSWRTWAGPLITRAEWEVAPGPDGVGGIRRLGRPRYTVREEIVAAEPPFHHAYRLLSGQPVRSYSGDVRLIEPDGPSGRGTGTRIEWTGEVVALVPCTGWLMQRLFRRMIHRFARGLAAAVESA